MLPEITPKQGRRANVCLKHDRKQANRHSQGVTAGYVRRFGQSAAKWSRWEKRVSLSVLLHKPLMTQANPVNDPSAEIGRPKQVRA